MNSKKFAKNLRDFIYSSPTAFHAVSTSKELLDSKGFIELDSCKLWDIKSGRKVLYNEKFISNSSIYNKLRKYRKRRI